MFFIKLLIAALTLTSSFSYAQQCRDLLSGLTESKVLRVQVNNRSKIFNNLELYPADISILSEVGYGASGKAYRISISGQIFILKAFYSDGHTLEMAQDSVIIQKLVSRWGHAPKVAGILSADFLNELMANSSQRPKNHGVRPFTFGLVMQEVSGLSTKQPTQFNSRDIELTLEQYEAVLIKADSLGAKLVKAGVSANDVDMFVTPEGELILIDFAAYHLNDYTKTPVDFRQEVEIVFELGHITIVE